MTKAAAVLMTILLVSLPADTIPSTNPETVRAVQLDGTDACQPDMVVIEDGTCCLPFVSVAMAAGYTDIQRGDDGAVTVSNGHNTVTAAPQHQYMRTGEHYIWLESCPTTDMDELLIPMEPLCRALGLDGAWHPETQTIRLNADDTQHQWQEHDEHLVLWLARAVWAEARGECLEGRIAVAQVILNRMASPFYPDTVTGVLFQPYQFSTADSGAIWNSANDDCFLAARLALDGADIVGNDCLYFNSCHGYTAGLTYITTIGGHKFYAR